MGFEGLRLFGSPLDKLRQFLFPASREFVLIPLPFVIGVFQGAANMEIQVVPNHHRFVAVWAEDNVADHKVAHRFDVCSVAFKAANENVPSIDVGQGNEIYLGLGIPYGCRFPLSCCYGALNRCVARAGSDLCGRLGFGGYRSGLALAFAKARLEIVADGRFGMERPRSCDENSLRFDVAWISDAAVHGA